MIRMDSCFSSRRGGLIKRSSEFVALVAIFATFFLLLHTRDLHSRLKEMENKLQPDELSGPPSMMTVLVPGAISRICLNKLADVANKYVIITGTR